MAPKRTNCRREIARDIVGRGIDMGGRCTVAEVTHEALYRISGTDEDAACSGNGVADQGRLVVACRTIALSAPKVMRTLEIGESRLALLARIDGSGT